METLVKVQDGNDDVVVGISGFGSITTGAERWIDLARLTGRTTFYLRYDAQELPFPSLTVDSTLELMFEARRRFDEARKGAREASPYLTKWLSRWAKAGRRILLVGFSLGAYLAWKAIQALPDAYKPQVELVMISGALVDNPRQWKGIDLLRRVVNGYSSSDIALRWVYPYSVDSDETPAAGLGPLTVSPSNVENVDLTDLIGRDHLWGSANTPKLIRICLGCFWGGVPLSVPSMEIEHPPLSDEAVNRLYRWLITDPDLWSLMAGALDGDDVAEATLDHLDRWSLSSDRLLALVDAGLSSATLSQATVSRESAVRGRKQLSGMIRAWIEGSL